MKKTVQTNEVASEQPAMNESAKVHPLLKSYTFVSKRHVDYHNLTAFESVSMSTVLVLAVLAGTVLAMNGPILFS